MQYKPDYNKIKTKFNGKLFYKYATVLVFINFFSPIIIDHCLSPNKKKISEGSLKNLHDSIINIYKPKNWNNIDCVKDFVKKYNTYIIEKHSINVKNLYDIDKIGEDGEANINAIFRIINTGEKNKFYKLILINEQIPSKNSNSSSVFEELFCIISSFTNKDILNTKINTADNTTKFNVMEYNLTTEDYIASIGISLNNNNIYYLNKNIFNSDKSELNKNILNITLDDIVDPKVTPYKGEINSSISDYMLFEKK